MSKANRFSTGSVWSAFEILLVAVNAYNINSAKGDVSSPDCRVRGAIPDWFVIFLCPFE
jgi:hypothetical protein